MIKKGMKRCLMRSVRVHIRREKAQIRRKTQDVGERERLITELYGRFGGVGK